MALTGPKKPPEEKTRGKVNMKMTLKQRPGEKQAQSWEIAASSMLDAIGQATKLCQNNGRNFKRDCVEWERI